MDDLSPSAIGLTALTQGVSFLFAQAGEILRARRKAREAASKDVEDVSYPVLEVPDSVFLPLPRGVARANGAAVELVADEIQILRGSLLPFAGPDATDSLNQESTKAFEQISRLRDLLESVYGTKISFRGEDRPGAVTTNNITVTNQTDGVHVAGNILDSTVAGRDMQTIPSKKR